MSHKKLKGIKNSAEFKAHFIRSQRALGEVVTEHRGEMSRAAFATKAKLSTGGLRRIEQGCGNPNLTRLANLAKAMGIKLSRLFELIQLKTGPLK